MNQKLVNYLYLLGATLLNCGLVAQIIKTYTTKSAGDIAILWLVLLAVGETFTSPRIFSSTYWCWKAQQVVLIVLLVILLAGAFVYR